MTAEVASASASYAAEVTRLLWPEPWEAPRVTRARQRTALGHEAYLFPSESNPRLLVPADLPQSSVMIRRLGGSRSGLVGPARRVLERSVRSRAFPLVGWPRLSVRGDDPDADSIERHLSRSLGSEVRVGILLGTRRVNQKPVLQVFRADGTVLGYAKIGHNPLTAALVRREAVALAAVAATHPRTFHAPRVLHHDQWAGLEVLVMSALASSGARVGPGLRLAAAREVTELGGRQRTALSTSEFATRLRARASLLVAVPEGRRLLDAVRVLTERHGDDALELGGWHGDWGHWNMNLSRGVLQVWDWERHERHVPLGFDELHFAAQAVRPEGRDARHQERVFLDSVDTLLAALDVPGGQRSVTLLLYLAEMTARYLEALGHGATPVLQLRMRWVISLLEQQLHHTRLGPNGAS